MALARLHVPRDRQSQPPAALLQVQPELLRVEVAKLWAERRAGELLGQAGFTTKPVRQLPPDISKLQSHRWQKLAAYPVDLYEQAVTDAEFLLRLDRWA